MICKFCKTHVELDTAGAWVDNTNGDVCSGGDACNNENQPHVVACTVITSMDTIDTENGPWYPTCGKDAVGMRADFPMCPEHMDRFDPKHVDWA